MKRSLTRSATLTIALVALALSTAGCKKEEQAKEVAPAPVQQAAAPAAPAAQAGMPAYDFESGVAGWSPAGKTVTIEAAANQKHGGSGSLKVSGSSGSPFWNFATSPQFSLDPGKKYRLSGWILIESRDNPKHPTVLKVGIQKNGKWAANGFTKAYNLKKMNEWQMVSGEFTTPTDGTISGRVSLEKGTQEKVEGIFYLDDIKVELVQ